MITNRTGESVISSSVQREVLETWVKLFRWMTQCRTQKSAYLMLQGHLRNFFIGLESIFFSESVRSYSYFYRFRKSVNELCAE